MEVSEWSQSYSWTSASNTPISKLFFKNPFFELKTFFTEIYKIHFQNFSTLIAIVIDEHEHLEPTTELQLMRGQMYQLIEESSNSDNTCHAGWNLGHQPPLILTPNRAEQVW